MSTILCRGLTFGYDAAESNVFDNFDLLIDSHWRAALVGRNGRGKTTLMRLVHRELVPQAGSIELAIDTRFFPQPPQDAKVRAFDVVKDSIAPYRRWERQMAMLTEAADDRSMQRFGSILEEFQRAAGYEVDTSIERELDALEIGPALFNKPFIELSGGEQTRCLLAGLFAGPEQYALIDEPTNHLDRAGRRRMADYLAAKPGFLLISHDRAFLDGCIDHVIALNPDTVDVDNGRFSDWRQRHEQKLTAQQAKNAELKREITSLRGTAEQRRQRAMKREATKAPHADKGFIGARAARQMKRAIAAERRANQAIDARKATLVDVERQSTLKLDTTAQSELPRTLLTATNVTIRRDRNLFRPISFRLQPGDRLAIIGGNGSGKTSLLDHLAGIEVGQCGGSLVKPGYVKFSRAYQHPVWTSGSLQEKLLDAELDEGRFRQVMAVLGVRGHVLEQPIEALSHGQQKKLDLARSLLTPADALLWDEPLNFIDIDTREQIEEVLLRQSPTMIFVEHDAEFVDAVATATIELRRPD